MKTIFKLLILIGLSTSSYGSDNYQSDFATDEEGAEEAYNRLLAAGTSDQHQAVMHDYLADTEDEAAAAEMMAQYQEDEAAAEMMNQYIEDNPKS